MKKKSDYDDEVSLRAYGSQKAKSKKVSVDVPVIEVAKVTFATAITKKPTKNTFAHWFPQALCNNITPSYPCRRRREPCT